MKYQEVEGLTLAQAQAIVKGDQYRNITVVHVMGVMRYDPKQAYDVLLRLHDADYLKVEGKPDAPKWDTTRKGHQLSIDSLGARFGKTERDEALAALLARAAEVNSDPDVLHRVRVLQFGSTLKEDAQDFGDIDIHVEAHPRSLSKEEKERISNLILETTSASRKSVPYPDSMIAGLEGHRRAEIRIKGRDSRVSICDSPKHLDTAYRVIADFDPETDKPIKTDASIKHGKASPEEKSAFPPPKNPYVPPLMPDDFKNTEYEFDEDIYLGTKWLNTQEEVLWTPVKNGNSVRPKVVTSSEEALCMSRRFNPGWNLHDDVQTRLSKAFEPQDGGHLGMPIKNISVRVLLNAKGANIVLCQEGHHFATMYFEKTDRYTWFSPDLDVPILAGQDLADCHAILMALEDSIDYKDLRKKGKDGEEFIIPDLSSPHATEYLDFSKNREVSLFKANIKDFLRTHRDGDLEAFLASKKEESWASILSISSNADVKTLKSAVREIQNYADTMELEVHIMPSKDGGRVRLLVEDPHRYDGPDFENA